MEDELKKDIIDGKIIDWSKLSPEELMKMKAEYQKKEKDLLKKIDNELKKDQR